MQGWGQRYLTVNPTGHVLPCPNATSIPDLTFDNVREYSLQHIWQESASFNRYRGEAWMPVPCRTCPEREIDFGGCRCQAALLTGDSFATDPVCGLAPHHALLLGIVNRENQRARYFHLASPPKSGDPTSSLIRRRTAAPDQELTGATKCAALPLSPRGHRWT